MALMLFALALFSTYWFGMRPKKKHQKNGPA
jgi:hypothetical protein